jgi:hypothetical protein
MRDRRDFVELRSELYRPCARYDDGAVAPAVYAVIKSMETELSWARHRKDATLKEIVNKAEDRRRF